MDRKVASATVEAFQPARTYLLGPGLAWLPHLPCARVAGKRRRIGSESRRASQEAPTSGLFIGGIRLRNELGFLAAQCRSATGQLIDCWKGARSD